MTDAELPIDLSAVPRFARGVRLRQDEVRQEWVLLAPERLVKCDSIAAAILCEIDGIVTLADIVARLAARYNADHHIIAHDVGALLANLRDKKMVIL